jgi:hypothetical protein
MRIVFVMRHPAAVRAYSAMLHLLSSRGHEVHLAFRRIKTGESHRELQRLADEWPGVTFGGLPPRGGRGVSAVTLGWSLIAEQFRHDVDYLRYLAPVYADAVALRARARVKARPSVRALARVASAVGGERGVSLLRRAIDGLESCIPPHPGVEKFVTARRPDVLLVSHLAEFGSAQTDFVRAARRQCVHTAYPVFSWDNLTNKGLIHEPPELVLVWNELQAGEAVDLQGVPRDRVRVTGAPNYDHWFDWQPCWTRQQLCDVAGLPDDRPFLLYVCSSAFIARDEVSFVRRWIAALRSRGGPLGETGVIVRPHPRNALQWAGAGLDDERAVVWPGFGEEPVAAESRRNYFDSIHHAAAVVGINTSAQIESAIVGRPVHTLLAEEFRDTQQGTLHFQHLKADEFGHLHVGRTMEEHLDQLEGSLLGRDDRERNERFLRRFVRPFGLDVAATPLLVDAIEELAARPVPSPARTPPLAPFVRLVLAPKAMRLGRRDLRARKEPLVDPLDQLRRTARRLGAKQTEAPVVAGPWRSDEVGELLYWIPFLRWAQVATFELRERLVVVARESSAAWYTGIGSRLLIDEEVGSVEELFGTDLRRLPASLVEERRAELSHRHPGDRFLRRLLEFEAPDANPLTGLDLPEDFVAVGLEGIDVAGRAVDIPADRAAELATLARARAFVGGWGPSALAAAMLGVPSIAVDRGDASEDDLRLAASFLPALEVVKTEHEAQRALESLRPRTANFATR